MTVPASDVPVRRTVEIEEWSNRRLIHPLSAALVPVLARLGVSPNAVSLSGMGCGLLAGLCYHWWRHPLACVLGFVLMLCWHVADGADGQLARLTGKQSASGKVLDGICDYVTFVAVYAALGVSLARIHGFWVVGFVILAGACHAVQAAAYEAHRERYDAIAHGRAAPLPVPAIAAGHGRRALRDGLYGVYSRVQGAAGGAGALSGTWTAALAARPDQAAALRARYRAAFAPLVRRWSVLCANYRTVGIFLCAACSRPLVYFGVEIVGLTLALLALLFVQHRAEAAFAAKLAPTYVPLPPSAGLELAGQDA